MILLALVLSVLTGYQIYWNVEPARGQVNGTVHLTVSLNEEDLIFVREDGSETASWEVVATIDGDLAVRNSGSIIKNELPMIETLSIKNVTTGSHSLVIIVGDLETGRSSTWEEEIEVPLIDSTCWSSVNLQISGGSYQRASGSIEVIWNVYPPTTTEIYSDTIHAAFALVDRNGTTIREGWMGITVSEDGYEGIASIDVNNLEAGRYEILAAIVGDDEIVATSKKELDLLQSWDVWGEDPDLTRKLIRPIASSAEMRVLDDTEGPSGRNAVMAEFWQRRDPSPVTVRNEFLEEYLERLDYIDENFSLPNMLGINTDQGRVYILLGEPDMIEQKPLEISTLPSQIWTYFTPPLEVYFIDYDGYGMFELYSEWEEVQNASERH